MECEEETCYNEKAWPGDFFLSSAHSSPAHLSVIGGDFVLEIVLLVRSVCPLFGIRRLSAIREQKMYCAYGYSGRYIHRGPLFGGGPLLGGSVIGGSTVVECPEKADQL